MLISKLAIKRLKTTKNIIKTGIGIELLAKYIDSSIKSKQVKITVGDITINNIDRKAISSMISFLSYLVTKYDAKSGEIMFKSYITYFYNSLNKYLSDEQAIKVLSMILRSYNDAVIGIKIENGYIDYILNYFNKRKFIIGIPIILANKAGNIFISDDAFPRQTPKENRTYQFYINYIKNSKVLDIGGYIGDTALYFYALGARHVKIYEPYFYDICKRNLDINRLKADVEKVAIGNGDIMCTENLDGLGLTISTPKFGKICVDSKKFDEVLNDKYDIVKVDCEGCERYLLDVDCNHIAMGDKWVIEVHEFLYKGLLKEIEQKFKGCGFITTYFINLATPDKTYTFYAYKK